MSRIFLAALVAVGLAPPAAAAPAPEPLAVSGEFHRVGLRVPLRLEVTEGEVAVAVAAEPAVRERLRIQVRGDELVIDSEGDLPWRASGLVTVRMKEFRGLRVEGSGEAEVTSGPEPRDVSLEVHGSGEASFRGTAGRLAVEIVGSGDVRARGDAGSLSVEVDGSGNASYAGHAGPARAKISGSGNVKLAGSGASLSAETSGSGDVDASGFPVKQATAKTSGSGNVAVRLDGGTLRVRIAGSGDVTWSGAGELTEARVSGSGEVLHR